MLPGFSRVPWSSGTCGAGGRAAGCAEKAVADSQYGTVESFRLCGELGIRPHMADLSQTQEGTGRRAGIFPESAFTYEPASDTYTCPAGQRLHRRRHHTRRRAYDYTAGPKVCGACELRAQCTRGVTPMSLEAVRPVFSVLLALVLTLRARWGAPGGRRTPS
jgi:hypothetical protein